MPENHLAGKVIVVTGAGSGFGALVSTMTAARGSKLALLDINEPGLQATEQEIVAGGGEALNVVTDVTDKPAMDAAVQAAIERFGHVDVLVNNAGIMPLAYFADHERAWKVWDTCIDVNVKGVVHGIAAVYDHMMEHGRGHVVNISSIYGNYGIPGAGVYSATKSAVTYLSDALRAECKGRIKVTTVKPTGVQGTNLASAIVNETAIIGLVGGRIESFMGNVAAQTEGKLPPEALDPDDIRYWGITPTELATSVVHVIDQPWGISISDITVRASADDYIY